MLRSLRRLHYSPLLFPSFLRSNAFSPKLIGIPIAPPFNKRCFSSTHSNNTPEIPDPLPYAFSFQRLPFQHELMEIETFADNCPLRNSQVDSHIALFQKNKLTRYISPVGMVVRIRQQNGHRVQVEGLHRICWISPLNSSPLIYPIPLTERSRMNQEDLLGLLITLFPTLNMRTESPSLFMDYCIKHFLENYDIPISQVQKSIEELDLKERLELVTSFQVQPGRDLIETSDITNKFASRLENLPNIPEEVKAAIEEEMSKLKTTNPATSDHNISYGYVDWLTSLPWGKFSKDVYSVEKTEKILNEDHFGLEKLKQRILEFIAVAHLSNSIQGKILCLVGPPGTGKTSIAKSIAKSLGREFYRISVGGLTDVSEIKGHRRTYIGAIPGKLIQALKQVQTSNPVILIDEIEKMGRSHYGDPAAALLEVLDPEQNKEFLDLYLDIPFDLSKVLFITTANSLSPLSPALLSRMEVLKLSGYTTEEKIPIAKTHLVPQLLRETGLTNKITIDDDTLQFLIRYYCREPGVRNLKKTIEKMLRKIAVKMVRGELDSVQITLSNVKDFAGDQIYRSNGLYEVAPVGVSTGLGGSPMGSMVLYVEAIADPIQSKDKLHCTGQLGTVLKESSNIAYTFARNFLASLDPSNRFFERTSVHLHIPFGSIQKEGASIGSTLVTSLLSLALGQSVKPFTAVVGEISATGKILPVPQLKEHFIAISYSNLKHIVLPEANRREFESLPANLKKGIIPHFVNHYDEIFPIVFPRYKLQGSHLEAKI